jgi:hypothetical protein
MKRILAVALVSALFTGCASTTSVQSKSNKPSFGAKILCANGLCSAEITEWHNKKMFEAASANCAKMGFVVTSQQFPQCVQNQIINARTRAIAENSARQRGWPVPSADADEMTRLNQPVQAVDQ